MNAEALVAELRAGRGFAHKQDIAGVLQALNDAASANAQALFQGLAARGDPDAPCPILMGDDCAAIPDGEGHLLLAIEGFVDDFVQCSPWFAGYCGVMVNVSDIYAMGGRPLAVVDALWSRAQDPARELLSGMRVAAQRYGVPIVGGHSNCRSERGQLAVAILGRAQRLLSSFDARPGDELIVAVDLRGEYEDPFPYWNASTRAPVSRLRADLEILPRLAESGLCDTAKDISMAGVLGTLLMMLECSKVGARLDIDRIPRPPIVDSDADLVRWLGAFPSYGFVLSVRPEFSADALGQFRARDLAAAVVGTVMADPRCVIQHRARPAVLWDFSAPFMLPRSSPTAGVPQCASPC